MFEQLLQYNRGTLMLYFGIVIVSTALAHFSQRATVKNRKNIYILSFVNTAFFAVFSNVGADRANYIEIFNTVTFDRILNGSEPGFELLQYLIHIVTKSPEVFISVISFWTVWNVYKGIWEFQDKISLGFAVFIFTSQYYFQSFSLIRLYFAASVLIRFAYLIKKEKYVKYALAILGVFFIHYSVIFAMAAYLLSFVFMKSKQHLTGLKFYLFLALSVLFSVFGAGFLELLLQFSENPVIYKYTAFLSDIEGGSIGLKWIFNILPYMFIFPFRKCFQEKEKKYIAFTMGYMTVAVAISLLSYSVPVIGRGLTIINFPVQIILPLGVGLYRDNREKYGTRGVILGIRKMGIRVSFRTMGWICCIWCIVSMLLYLSGYMLVDKIDNYRFLWG